MSEQYFVLYGSASRPKQYLLLVAAEFLICFVMPAFVKVVFKEGGQSEGSARLWNWQFSLLWPLC